MRYTHSINDENILTLKNGKGKWGLVGYKYNEKITGDAIDKFAAYENACYAADGTEIITPAEIAEFAKAKQEGLLVESENNAKAVLEKMENSSESIIAIPPGARIREQPTVHEFAALIHGKEYDEFEAFRANKAALLKDLGYIVVYGASDDLCEIDGLIYDEASCYNGGSFYLTDKSIFVESQGEDIKENLQNFPEFWEIIEKEISKWIKIEALWCEGEIPWTYKVHPSHVDFAEFDIFEDGELFCKGLIIDLKGFYEKIKKNCA